MFVDRDRLRFRHHAPMHPPRVRPPLGYAVALAMNSLCYGDRSVAGHLPLGPFP